MAIVVAIYFWPEVRKVERWLEGGGQAVRSNSFKLREYKS
jgi:hypothetical protein